MGQSLEKAVSKAATESGLLGIESAEINFDSDINLNLDSSAIGIVVAVLVGLVIVIVIIVTLCSRYCCNCCDNLCFQGRGQNLHKKVRVLHVWAVIIFARPLWTNRRRISTHAHFCVHPSLCQFCQKFK